MFEKLGNLDIKLTESQIISFENFCNFFMEYNSKINLVSRNDEQYLFEKHIFDSLAFNLFYMKYFKNKTIKLLDIGSGGGFPSIPIALYNKYINVTAVDSINKKVNFINLAKETLKIDNINAICSRIENLDIKMREYYDVVTVRAMARLNIIMEYAIPYLKTGGCLVAYKSIKSEEELEQAENAIKILNAKFIEKIEYVLPLKELNKRNLIIIKKISSTENKYPRSNGFVKKNPL